MAINFKQLIAGLDLSSPVANDLSQIIVVLQQPFDEALSSFICHSSDELLILEKYAWQLLCQDSHFWISQSSYPKFFHSLAMFNKSVIFECNDIDSDVKASLLYPVTTDQIDAIFKQLNQTDDDNDLYITIVSLYFDNHSYFLHENPQQNVLSIIDYISQSIVHNYVMTEQFNIYLSNLRQPQLAQSMFTAKMLFYMKTCSFILFAHAGSRVDQCPFSVDEILDSIGNDYLYIVHVHSLSVESWSKELLACLAHLISFVSISYGWNRMKREMSRRLLFSNEEMMCDHVQDLVRIIDYKPFQEQIRRVRSNDETALIDGASIILLTFVRFDNMAWFFRSVKTTIQKTVLTLAESLSLDTVCFRAYGILSEVMTDEELKRLKNTEHINKYFFQVLELAWHDRSKKYKRIPIGNLLKGYLRLSQHDLIKQKAADTNKIPLLIEMCDSHPIIYDILWTLSFNNDIQEQLHSDTSFVSKLCHLANEDGNEQTRKTTQGILWNIRFSRENFPTTEVGDATTFDIMISYSHKQKVLCKQIYDELIKRGYHVWIDFDQMHGNTMDAMAQAIDRCHTVIICVSEQYRQSNYCRAEAQYAFQKERKIVPVLLQTHCKPDGWLLFVVGQLLYVDFTKYDFARAIEMLEKELEIENLPKTTSESTLATEIIKVLPTVAPTSPLSVRSQNIFEWSQAEVQHWLLEHDLVQMSHLLAACDGRSLVYLNGYMRHGDPQLISRSLEGDSMRRTNQSLSLIELSRLQSLLDCETELIRSTKPNRTVISNIVDIFSTITGSCDIL